MKTKKLLLTAVATLGLAAGTMAQNVPNYVPTNGLVGWWPFNGNANDESGNGNNGTVNGATLTSDRFGGGSNSYYFNGSSKISVSDNPQFDFNDFTVACWIQTSQTNSNPNWESGIVSKNISSGIPSWWIYLNHANSTFGQGLVDFYLRIGNTQNFTAANNSYNDNNWHFIVAKRKSNTGELTIIVDGTDSAKVSGATGLISVPEDLVFGHTYPGDAHGYFLGKIDDIGIWNRLLSYQEVLDLFNGVNCASNLSISPSINNVQSGSTANFVASTTDPNPTYVWQSDFGQGFQTLNNYGKYSGVNTNALAISNVQLSEHNQPVRAISTSGNCVDTSNVAIISISDTCINTVNDTNFITVTDTLLINALITSVTPSINNLIKVYPNPAISHLYIDNGNYQSMSGYSIRIDNSLGQQVFQSAINQQQFYVDLSTWSGNGLYFMHLINPQGQSIDIRKIVLQ